MFRSTPTKATASAKRDRGTRLLCALQGGFYLLTGIWPVLSGYTFQRVTGFKADFWLAQTVGLLLAMSGLVMIVAARARRITPEIALLAAGEAVLLAIVDIYCVGQPHTTRVYLIDAAAEIILVLAWLRFWPCRSDG
ncbi:MAG TPA: hypothetical protein VFT72_00525 [Opitutaceae bacterium]|nr:hypothetical protein [Opitutaceae bacterium]